MELRVALLQLDAGTDVLGRGVATTLHPDIARVVTALEKDLAPGSRDLMALQIAADRRYRAKVSNAEERLRQCLRFVFERGCKLVLISPGVIPARCLDVIQSFS